MTNDQISVRVPDSLAVRRTLPGATARHCVITPACIRKHGRQGAIDEALRLVRQSLVECVDGWEDSRPGRAYFHVACSVERPESEVKS